MSDQDGSAAAAASEAEAAAPVPVQIAAESGDAETEQCQPFFSMCLPIRSVSYSNPWDIVCAPTIKSSEHNSNLDSMLHKYAPSNPCSDWSEYNQAHSESGTEPCDTEGNQLYLSFSHSIGSELVGAGLSNMGNTCFLNAILQPGQQEDAHEFLSCLLANLDECTTDPKPKDKPSSFNEESIVKQLICCECGHCSETYEPFLDLSLEIDQVDNLVHALESFTKLEQVGDPEDKLICEHCNTKVCKNKQLMIDRSPDVIAFHLKRFTTLDNSVEKISKHVVYPLELDLKPFHSDPDVDKELKYDLYAVVEHQGLYSHGHYVCSVRSSSSTWHLMNDSHVETITEAKALDQEGYILFYVRQGKFQWFSSLLEQKDVLHPESTSPVSVLENIDVDCPTSSGEGTNNSSGDNLEKDETSQCKTSFLPEEPAKGCPVTVDLKDEIMPCISSRHDGVAIRCHLGSGAEITNSERPSTPPRRKRFFSDNELNVFEYEDFGNEDEEIHLFGNLKFPSKAKKAKGESASKSMKGPCIDKNVTRLVRSMPSARRKGMMDCLNSQIDAEQDSRSCPRSHPLSKKKLSVPVPINW
uniref:Ubiquitin carboxyl-terminal hydrolase n=1 Tax=Leersia perrieri TaxID=77586 RepID=A0A0D9VI66_9ORYZ